MAQDTNKDLIIKIDHLQDGDIYCRVEIDTTVAWFYAYQHNGVEIKRGQSSTHTNVASNTFKVASAREIQGQISVVIIRLTEITGAQSDYWTRVTWYHTVYDNREGYNAETIDGIQRYLKKIELWEEKNADDELQAHDNKRIAASVTFI